MKFTFVRDFFRKFRKPKTNELLGVLQGAHGVIHIGANKGQERELYDQLGLNVLWIEAIPDVCAQLRDNVSQFPKQKVVEALLLDRDDVDIVLHVANNGGASSSIFNFKLHSEIWPKVKFTHDVNCRSQTLTRLLQDHHIETSLYDALVLDTQGLNFSS